MITCIIHTNFEANRDHFALHVHLLTQGHLYNFLGLHCLHVCKKNSLARGCSLKPSTCKLIIHSKYKHLNACEY